MSAVAISIIVTFLLVLVCGLAIGVTCWWPVEHPGLTVAAIQRRLELEMQGRKHDPALWPIGWPHETPERPMTLAEAHTVMQRHRECSTTGCARKATAFDTLVVAGRIRPDQTRRTTGRRRK